MYQAHKEYQGKRKCSESDEYEDVKKCRGNDTMANISEMDDHEATELKRQHKKKKKFKERELGNNLVDNDLSPVEPIKSKKEKRKHKRNNDENSDPDHHEATELKRQHKKKKKFKEKELGNNLDNDLSPVESIKSRKKKKRKRNNDENSDLTMAAGDDSREMLKVTDDCVESDGVVINCNNLGEVNMEVTGFAVDDISNSLYYQKRNKKKRSNERMPSESLLGASTYGNITCEELDSSTNISQLLANNSVSPVLDDTELLMDKISSYSSGASPSLECNELELPVSENINSVVSSTSWHVPETPPKKTFKTMAREAVRQALASAGALEDKAEESLDRLDLKSGDVKGRLMDPSQELSNCQEGCEEASPTSSHSPRQNAKYDSSIGRIKVLKATSVPELSLSGGLKKGVHNNNTVTIGDLYKLPKKRAVPPVLRNACKFIFSQAVAVSELNTAYTGHCVPRGREYRGILRRKYGAKFGRYYEEQDTMLLSRFNTLVQQGVVEDKEEFCHFLNIYCSGKDQAELMKSTRNIGIRNIVGLFIGQDIPQKLAAVHCLRLIKLVLGKSYLFRHSSAEITTPSEGSSHRIPPTNKDVVPCKAKAKSVKKWTLEEDKVLVDLVTEEGVLRVEDVDPMKVDWAGIAGEFDRKLQYVREHWARVVQPVLVEDIEVDSIMDYRRRLLEEVIKMKAGHKKDINWIVLAKKFHPRSAYSIQHNLNDLVKEGRGSTAATTAAEFQGRLRSALAKAERLAQLPEGKLLAHVKRSSYKTELRGYYQHLIDKVSMP